eukprot:gnl/TRDRNA2_/TRDRNA2_38466_c0_seq1.p1 gnl/TRDRNA2_/TRDRNA2_38466_c0~~gnl/TRDRNA2_/TRDRNA2_38466_c0_seq1.p1  ORF type:complete len:166 (-),score=4.82 gnl/TRDRNA2_/TRDRNA2_38466_c0_seq1:18-494(-)
MDPIIFVLPSQISVDGRCEWKLVLLGLAPGDHGHGRTPEQALRQLREAAFEALIEPHRNMLTLRPRPVSRPWEMNYRRLCARLEVHEAPAVHREGVFHGIDTWSGTEEVTLMVESDVVVLEIVALVPSLRSIDSAGIMKFEGNVLFGHQPGKKLRFVS